MRALPLPFRSVVLWSGLILAAIAVQTGFSPMTKWWSSGVGDVASPMIIWRFGWFAMFSFSTYISVLIAISASRTAKRSSPGEAEIGIPDTVRDIGVLVDRLDDRNGRIERQSKARLIALLPLVTARDSHLLDEYQQAKLRYIVRPPASPMYSTYLMKVSRNSPQNVALRAAIVEALSRIGDREALTMFDELLECRATTPADQRLQQLVRELRPALVIRVSREPARMSLLRPADLLDARILVRSAARKQEAPSHELLHISAGERSDSNCGGPEESIRALNTK